MTGPPAALDAFVAAITAEAPPLSRIESVTVQDIPGNGFARFEIRHSHAVEGAYQPISPDVATCPECLAEVRDPSDRRYRYPFINCTNCGPRFTIIQDIPYDRPATTMAPFAMCPECQREYDDPHDRRFHAQPNACPVCGPQLSWHDGDGRPLAGDPLTEAAAALAAGAVVAIKGLGGFHLAVDAGSAEAVERLRGRKRRPGKPLAVMVADLAAAERLCRVAPVEAELLTSTEHPIVLLDRLPAADLAPEVAPGLGILGVMLAYTPLHHLLLAEPQAPAVLVMTSGNLSDEPICTGNDEALARLRGLADFFLLHNREIVTRVDDSVARVMDGRPRLLRRARGYSPVPILLQRPTRDILACGARMKNTFCLVRQGRGLHLSQHIGELTGPESLDFYHESITHLQSVLSRASEWPATCPDYLSSRHARALGLPCTGIQHHHAHVGAVLAEQGLDGPVLGRAGRHWLRRRWHGLGRRGAAGGPWQRHPARPPRPPALPGGDRAAREPWRMALALLHRSAWPGRTRAGEPARGLRAIDPQRQALLIEMIERGLNTRPPRAAAGCSTRSRPCSACAR